jgi:hypothetical protein
VGGKGDRPASLENRWWVDQQRDDKGYLIERERVPLKFFRTGAGFDQDRAQRRLTDLNLKWFDEAPGPPGEWVVLRLLDKQRVPDARVEKVKRALPIPRDGHAVLVDSGDALRAIITGHPHGERLVEVRIGRDSSFDAWVRGEWVREQVFRDADECIRRAPRLVRDYLVQGRGEPIVG